jgi:predicted dienelactone hydrolase
MVRKLALGIAALLVVAAAGAAIALAMTAPEPPPVGSESARRLEPGPHAVARSEYTFVDETRPTAPNDDAPGATSRSFESALWYPLEDASPHPFIVYSHGFMSTKEEAAYLAEHLASHGYVVIATDYPLTNFATPGGPNVADFINQPADVSFLIDTVLALEGDGKPFAGPIDVDRIGAMGLSLGGLTTTLVTFHPELRDPRIRAAVSIAGPGALFGKAFFDTADVPFLMIAGTEDAMVDYETNALPILERARTGALVTIEAGSHTGFASIADPLFRFVDNPDSVGCGALMNTLDIDVENEADNPFTGLGGEENGILVESGGVMPCQGELASAIHPGRQHMITKLAATDFFLSVFGDDPETRAAGAQHLASGIAKDFDEARFAKSRL